VRRGKGFSQGEYGIPGSCFLKGKHLPGFFFENRKSLQSAEAVVCTVENTEKT